MPINKDNSKKVFIYALCDPITFEVRYVGKSYNIYQRYHHHITEKRKTYKCNWIQKLLKGGLLPKLCILEECNIINCDEREKYWISFEKMCGCNLTNATSGGDGSCDCLISEENKLKIKLRMVGKNIGKENPFFGKHHSEETRNKIRQARLGKHHSEETKIKLGKISSNRIITDEFRKKMSDLKSGNKNHMFGKHHSKEAKKKISIKSTGNKFSLGTHHSEEVRKRISESHKGNNNYFFGKHHSEESRKKISLSSIGRHPSEETRKKMSLSHINRWNNKKNKVL